MRSHLRCTKIWEVKVGHSEHLPILMTVSYSDRESSSAFAESMMSTSEHSPRIEGTLLLTKFRANGLCVCISPLLYSAHARVERVCDDVSRGGILLRLELG